ncbi:MAG: HAD family phosphatase [Pyramidobacter sp.]|nr:HAD family phosphatase [Pyramidobacter sp.]
MNSPVSFTAGIFDLDGTLIDSRDVWNRIDEEFVARRGFAVPPDYLAAVRSMRFSEAADYTIERFSLSDSPGALMNEWYEMAVDQYSYHVPLKPHVREYLCFLKSAGVRLATATSLPETLYSAVLKGNGVFDLFDAHTSADEAPRGKEHPDTYLLAARKLGAAPEECMVFEDVLVCIKSARAAGMKVCAVYDRAASHEWDDMTRAADISIRDFSELLC